MVQNLNKSYFKLNISETCDIQWHHTEVHLRMQVDGQVVSPSLLHPHTCSFRTQCPKCARGWAWAIVSGHRDWQGCPPQVPSGNTGSIWGFVPLSLQSPLLLSPLSWLHVYSLSPCWKLCGYVKGSRHSMLIRDSALRVWPWSESWFCISQSFGLGQTM